MPLSKEEQKKYDAAYYQKNKNKIKARKVDYHVENRDKINTYVAGYHDDLRQCVEDYIRMGEILDLKKLNSSDVFPGQFFAYFSPDRVLYVQVLLAL